MKKLISFVSLLALVMLVSPAGAAVIGTINLNGTTSPNVGSTLNLSGACDTTATGTVNYTLVRDGVSTNVGSSTLGANGSFGSNVSVPSNYGSGSATLIATCPNGDTVTQNLNVMVPMNNNLTVNGNAQANGNLTLNGWCGTMSAGQSVDLRLVRNGVVTDITNVTTTGTDGNFNGTITIPSDYLSGDATLMAICPNGGTVSSVINIAANTNTGNNNNNNGTNNAGNTLVVHTENPAVGNVLRFSGICGTTAGGEVQVTLANGSTQTLLGRLITEENGVFNASLTIPDNVATGNTQLQALCPNGQVVATAITLTPDNDAANNSGTTGTNNNASGTTATGSVSDAGDVGGTAEAGSDVTPVGGVEAGNGSTAGYSNMLVWLLMAIGLGAVVSYKYAKPSLN